MTYESNDGLNSQNSNSGSILVRSRTVLAEVCQRMRPHLKWVARQQTQRLPNCKADESDIVQISIAKAYERFEQFEGNSLKQWRAWLIQIVRNNAKDVLRYWTQERRAHKNEEHGSHLMRGLADGSMETPSKVMAEQERQQQVDAVMSSLSIDEQQLIRWKWQQGLTYREIAKRLNICEITAKRRLEAAASNFRERMTALEA